MLEAAFQECFGASHNTLLRGGAPEPLYEPPRDGRPGLIHYRADYAASALHEVAHWCIAGTGRRELEDYGYWYEPDGRDARQQAAFEQVEVRPQAVEWHFALAAGLEFRVSFDNLSQAAPGGDRFANAVLSQARRFCEEPLPPRAELFRRALADRLGGNAEPTPGCFQGTGA